MIKFKKKTRVKTPTIIQMDAIECGVVSLAIVLGYYKKFVPLEQLRVDCGVSRDGSNAFNILKTAEKYGLKGEGKKSNFDELQKEPCPYIIFWNFNHFVVVEGIGKKEVFINDPNTGPRKVTIEEFKEAYSGLALVFSKTPDFKEGGEPSNESVIKMIYERCKTSKKSLSYLFMTGLCLLLPGFAMPAFLMFFLQMFFGKNINPMTVGFVLAVIFTSIFAFLGTLVQRLVVNRLGARLAIKLSNDFLWKLFRLPSQFYSQRYSGEIAWRMSLATTSAEYLSNYLILAVLDVILVLFYGAILFFYNSYLAAIVLIIAGVSFWMMKYVFKTRSDTYARLQQNMGRLSGESIGGLKIIETIKSKGIESSFFTHWVGHYTKKVNSVQALGCQDSYLLAVPIFFQYLAITVLIGLGSFFIIKGSISTAVLFPMQLLAMNFLSPINRFVGYSQLIQEMKIDLQRLNDVLKNPDDEIYAKRAALPHTKDTPSLKGVLEFKNVNFRYAPLSPYILEDISFKIGSGERVAFVGETGCGKSTIAKLALGLYYPEAGEVRIDNKLHHEITAEQMRSAVTSVDQEILIFSGTIRENLTLWNPKVTDQQLIRAAQDAEIHDVVVGRKDAYETYLIEGGLNFSGGERQRLEIARALLYEPVLLILDEATSALDSDNEKKIAQNLRARGISTLIIAHRLSTIQDCDCIYVVDKGKIVQSGLHEELKESEGIYKNLITSETF